MENTKIEQWVLTSMHNDYDQHGEYFVSFFREKPSFKAIKKVLSCKDELANHILNGGGRQDVENQWFLLKKLKEGVNYHD